MKFTIYCCLVFLLSLFSCSDIKLDERFERDARLFAEVMDSNAIEMHKEWDLRTRGIEAWCKESPDSIHYCCFIQTRGDTFFLEVSDLEQFLSDFPMNCRFPDASNQLCFLLLRDTLIKVASEEAPMVNLITSKVPFDSLFLEKDPFADLRKLDELCDRLGYSFSIYNREEGDFIQFYLSLDHVVTWIADDPKFHPEKKEKWLDEFAKGKFINKNWNYRRLDQPLDAG